MKRPPAHLATPHLATPRLATPRLATPRLPAAWLPAALAVGALALAALAPGRAAAIEDAAAADPISWEGSYAQAVKRATDDDRPLLLKFYTGWCVHCTRMDRTTWRDDGVADLAASFVTGNVNADVDKVPVRRYGLTGYPTVIVAEPGGEQVLRLEGYQAAPVIRAYLKAYLEHEQPLAEAFATLRRDRRDAGAQLAVADFYQAVSLHGEAARRYQGVLRGARGETAVLAGTGAGASLLALDDARGALRPLRAALDAAGPAAPARLLLLAARAEKAAGEATTARALFTRVMQEHGGSSEADAAKAELAAP